MEKSIPSKKKKKIEWGNFFTRAILNPRMRRWKIFHYRIYEKQKILLKLNIFRIAYFNFLKFNYVIDKSLISQIVS